LVYEVVWLRLSMAKFGVTTPMVSIVLSVFMAGLGLGSWGGGALIRRLKQPTPATTLRLYGLLEILIGISSILVPVTLNLGYGLLRDSGAGFAWGSSSYYFASGGWVALALIPWCACMGATFPFAMASIRAIHGEELQHSFSYLYLANVLGAVLGTLVPAIFLIELFGFQGTLHIAGTLNCLLAAGVFLMSRSVHAASSATTAPVASKSMGDSGTGLLWLLFTTGLCSMAMEVVWIREFTTYLGNVVYAFATILALYLLATFLGSAIYRRRAALSSETGNAAWICLGLAALLPLIFADPRFPAPAFDEDSFAEFAYSALRATLAIGPFSGLVGFLTPMLVDRWSQGDPNRAGRAYAVNVLGSILGPVLAGFWILPWVGERWALCLISIPVFATGLNPLRSSVGLSWKIKPAPMYLGALGLSAIIAILARSYDSSYPQRVELRDYTATVIATGEGMERQLLVNGIGMTRLTPITKMMAHFPLSMLPRPATNGLVICFGMGTTFRSMLSWGIETTAVDLVPSVPKMFGYYHPDGPELLKSPLAHVVIDDGRRFLERSTLQFDIIVTDPPPPIGAPTSSLLYSEEFYTIIKPHLRPGGILQVWCPGGDQATMAAIAKALRSSFPYQRAYESIEGWGVHFVASMTPLPIATGEQLASRLPRRAAEDLVEWNGNATPQHMLTDLLNREQPLDRLIEPEPSTSPITDNRPINEYFLLRSIHAKPSVEE
jgi:spermidine synthase